MRIPRKTKKAGLSRLLPIFALMLVMGAFFMGTTAYAAATETAEPSPEPAAAQSAGTAAADQNGALLIVKEVWLTGDTLHISVTDSMGAEQTLELNLRDYAQSADEYVTVQATDSAGHTSNTIQFKNPYYTANSEPSAEDESIEADETPSGSGASESSVPDGENPFTPEGSGTVIDDATDGDGKEFFTVETPDGNTFYLIVDRQRSGDNVYLLDAVSEDDLASLAKPGDGESESAVETPAAPAPAAAAPAETTTELSSEPESEPAAENNSVNMGMIAFAVIAVLAAGGIGYYIKIIRPKKNGADEYAEGDFDNDTEADLDGGKDGDGE